MWIKDNVYEIRFNGRTLWSQRKGLLINVQGNSGQILCQKGCFSDLIGYLDNKFDGETINLIHNIILPEDKSTLLSFFKGVEAYGKKDGSKLSTEDLDIISENFANIFLNKKTWVKKVYNFLTIEE